MAEIHLNPALPNNIVELGIDDCDRMRHYYEKGYLIILNGVQIEADFDFLKGIPIIALNSRRKKYILTHPAHYRLEKQRDDVWEFFKDKVFQHDLFRFSRFQEQVFLVNRQVLELCRRAFPSYRCSSQPITWKFLNTRGENLHIDNIDGCDKSARLRVFVNLGTEDRIWGLGNHLRNYSDMHFRPANLGRYAGLTYRFNQALSLSAFGRSTDVTGNQHSRHIIHFKPGEVWFLNSSVTAHQIIRGTLCLIGSFVFPYRCYHDPKLTLPSLVAEICRLEMGAWPYLKTMAKNRVLRMIKMEKN
jgi:hypothetical protein